MNIRSSDNRFKIIKELKEYIIESTNINTSPKEMEVLDVICFRLWQLGLTLENKRKLEKENQELKEAYDKLDNNFHSCYLDYKELEAENEKLKNAIEILKEKPEVLEFGLENFEWDEYEQLYIYVHEYKGTAYEYNFFTEEYEEIGSIETEEYSLTKQEYDTLKEVALRWKNLNT